MKEFVMIVASCVAVLTVAAMLAVIFYKPKEMRRDLRSPRLSKQYKKEMQSELRWRKATILWLIVFSLLLGIAVMGITYLLASIVA